MIQTHCMSNGGEAGTQCLRKTCQTTEPFSRSDQMEGRLISAEVNSTLIETKNVENKIEGEGNEDFYFHALSFLFFDQSLENRCFCPSEYSEN